MGLLCPCQPEQQQRPAEVRSTTGVGPVCVHVAVGISAPTWFYVLLLPFHGLVSLLIKPNHAYISSPEADMSEPDTGAGSHPVLPRTCGVPQEQTPT